MGDLVPIDPDQLPRRLGADQLHEVLDEASAAVDRLRRDGAALLARARQSTGSGYPTRSIGDGRGSGVVDPVGDLVVREEMADPLRVAVARMCHLVVEARNVLRAADAARAGCSPRTETQIEPQGVCLNCWRYEVSSPVHKAARCRACYDWRLRHGGHDAPSETVLAREDLVARRRAARAS